MRAGTWITALTAAAAVAVPAALVLSHAGDEVYAIPGWGVALTIVLGLTGLGGAALIAWARNPIPSAATVASTALGVLGVLAFAAVGLLLLVPIIAFLPIALSDRWSERRRTAAIGGAVLAGAVIPVLVVIAASGPVVECAGNRTSTGENLFMAVGGGTSEGAIIDTFEGPDTGSGRGDNYEYTFACDGSRLVEFDLRWR